MQHCAAISATAELLLFENIIILLLVLRLIVLL